MLSCYLQRQAVVVYEIKTNDVYEDFSKDEDLFDFGDYPQDSKFFDLTNKNVIGKMKGEFKGKKYKSKMYFLIHKRRKKKAKEVNKKAAKNIRQKNTLKFCSINK